MFVLVLAIQVSLAVSGPSESGKASYLLGHTILVSCCDILHHTAADAEGKLHARKSLTNAAPTIDVAGC